MLMEVYDVLNSLFCLTTHTYNVKFIQQYRESIVCLSIE